MFANRILKNILRIFSIVVLPFWLVMPFVLGLAVVLTFGLLMLPISLIWMLLLFPMVALSWICNKVPSLRNVIGIIFIPWVVVAETYIMITPSMGELESRALKLMLCNAWPFTWELWLFSSQKLDLHSEEADDLKEIIEQMCSINPIIERVAMRLLTGQQLDSNEVV
jgi:hypothetical protein